MSDAWAHAAHPEWQLISGAISKGVEGDTPVAKTLAGDFEHVLRSPRGRALLAPLARDAGHALQAKEALAWRAGTVELPRELDADAALEVLAVAVSALHAFVQLNWTGPDLSWNAQSLLRSAAPSSFPPRDPEAETDAELQNAMQAASLEFLTKQGEPAYHLCEAPVLLVFALLVLEALAKHSAGVRLPSLVWWRVRAAAVHHRILDEPVRTGSVLDTLGELAGRLGRAAAEHADEADAWRHLQSRALLERGLALQREGLERDASELFVAAAQANGLEYELTGAPGKRTRYQKHETTQLVLLAESRGDGGSGERAADEASAKQPTTLALNDDTLLEHTEFTRTSTTSRLAHLDPGAQPPLQPTDQCVLLALCLNIRNTQPMHGLTTSEMAAFLERVLAHARNWSVHTMGLLLRSRLEMQRTRTAERATLQLQALVDQMPTADSHVEERLRYFHALELEPRWAMQAELAEQYATLGVLRSALEIYGRLQLWEDAVRCLALLGRAQEGIELVDDLLHGRKVEADVVMQQKRIATSASQVRPEHFSSARAAKLWCLLGDLDVAHAEEHYQRAWDVSQRTSSRAARSLGGLYFAKGEYRPACEWLQRAVRINALFVRSWFMLGCSAMGLERWVDAAAAFRKCTALDEDDGESWNNLASCYLRMDETQAARLEAVERAAEDDGASLASDDASTASADTTSTARDSGVEVESDADEAAPAAPAAGGASAAAAGGVTHAPFSLRELAHRALEISLKYHFDTWRVWANFMVVSVDIGQLQDAARALSRIVEIRTREQQRSREENTRAAAIVDMAVLQRLVDAVIRAPPREEDAVEQPETPAAPGTQHRVARNPNEGHGLYTSVRRLFDDTLLPHFSTDSGVLQSYARLLFWRSEYRAMLEARVKSFRFGAGSAANTAVTTDKAAWLAGVHELQDLVDALENLGTRAAAPDDASEAMPDWRFQARTLVRGYMARTRESFEEEPEWELLTELLAGLRA